MSQRQAAIVFAPTAADEAPGVTIRRAIGGERMCILDPFLLLDHASVVPGSDVVGFPRHPHRGIETLSYVLTGQVGHKDSMGNEGTVGAGGVQWMTAGNGIFHEEMLIPGPEGAEFLQLWFSLPREQKRIRPAYEGVQGENVPTVTEGGATVRVVAGSFKGVEGPFQRIAVRPTVLGVILAPGASVEIPAPQGEATIAYIARGTVTVGDRAATAPEILVLGDGDSAVFSAGPEGSELLFVSAAPLNESIVQYRSLVMSTVDDIRESLDMIEAGTFAK